MAGASFGARMASGGARMAESVSGMGRKMSARGMGTKMDMRSRIMAGEGNPFGNALRLKAGHRMMKTGDFIENNPRGAMGIAAGVTGAGLMASNRKKR
jgi:hypothetical protein